MGFERDCAKFGTGIHKPLWRKPERFTAFSTGEGGALELELGEEGTVEAGCVPLGSRSNIDLMNVESASHIF